MKDPAALPTEIRGSTNAFVVKPANLAITRVETLTGVANPGATNAVGPAFVAAGAPFRVEVDALDSEGSLTPSFGTETPPEGIRIGSSTLDRASGRAQRQQRHGYARRGNRIRRNSYQRALPR